MKRNNSPKYIVDLSNYLIGIKNLSKNYVKSITTTVEQFLEFINTHKLKNEHDLLDNVSLDDIRSLTNSDIYSFIYFLAECHYSSNSRIIKIGHLKVFFEFLFSIKHQLFQKTFKTLSSERRKDKRLPNYLSIEEAKKLLDVYSDKENIIEIRNKAILHLFLNSGLRLSEMRNLNINDFVFEDNRFSIIGKGNKERTGYLNNVTRKALDDYLKIRSKFTLNSQKEDVALFLSIRGKRIGIATIKDLVKKAYQISGLGNMNYSVHTLRHTCATILYKTGTDIKTIQELLGHVQVDTTQIYTHFHNEEVRESMLAHPLAQFKMSNALAYCA